MAIKDKPITVEGAGAIGKVVYDRLTEETGTAISALKYKVNQASGKVDDLEKKLDAVPSAKELLPELVNAVEETKHVIETVPSDYMKLNRVVNESVLDKPSATANTRLAYDFSAEEFEIAEMKDVARLYEEQNRRITDLENALEVLMSVLFLDEED